jgi:hypothetical protein
MSVCIPLNGDEVDMCAQHQERGTIQQAAKAAGVRTKPINPHRPPKVAWTPTSHPGGP